MSESSSDGNDINPLQQQSATGQMLQSMGHQPPVTFETSLCCVSANHNPDIIISNDTLRSMTKQLSVLTPNGPKLQPFLDSSASLW
jgi:hypothetical protein